MLAGACNRNQSGVSSLRIAILPSDILITDQSSSALSVAIPLVLQQDLSTSRRSIYSFASSQSLAYQMGDGAVLRTTLENRKGRLILKATITDLSSQKTRQFLPFEGPQSLGLLSLLDIVAKRIDESATQFSSKSDRAVSSYIQALQAPQREQRVQLLTQAVNADPSFGLAYLSLIETASQAGSQNLGPLVAQAAQHRDSFTPVDRARFDALVKRFSRVPLADQAKATQAILNLAPNDVQALASLGTAKYRQGDPSGGEQLLRHAVDLDPGNLTIRLELADMLLTANRPSEALRTLTDLAELRPDDPRVKQALGQLQFSEGQFKDAEQNLAALGDDPAALEQQAVCILLEGDLMRATNVFEKYLALRQKGNDPFVSIARASWFAITGHRTQAIDYLQSNKFPQDDLRSIALSQIALWSVGGKDFTKAKATAAESAHLANTPVAKTLASLAGLIAASDMPSKPWMELVRVSPLDGSSKQIVTGYGLFLNGRFAESEQVWQSFVQLSHGADQRAQVMLTASRLNQGLKSAQPGSAPRIFFPNLTGGDQFAFVSFAEMLRTQANLPNSSAKSYETLLQLYKQR